MCAFDGRPIIKSQPTCFVLITPNVLRLGLQENATSVMSIRRFESFLIMVDGPGILQVLRVKKMAPPLRLVTPPQSISESGGAEDLVSGAAETVSSRALTSSASSRTLNSSSAASKEVCGTDVPAFSYVEAASSNRAQLLVVDGQSQNLGSLNKHQGKASSDDRNHNYMTVQGQSTASDHDPTELDGESVYNLEEFPSLIEAEEIIDIFPLDSDSSEAQLSPVESIQVVRKTHHMRADLT